LNPDKTDLALDSQRNDKELLLLGHAEQQLPDINQALYRLEEDRYGICLECGKNLQPTRLEIIQAKMDKMVITAPYDGIVSIVRAKQGEWANPGELMVELLDISRWKIETKNVGELQIGRVEIGHDVQVSVNAFKDKALNGRVVAISPVAIVQQGDTTYTLSIELDPTNLNLLPGMTAQVEIRTDGDL
jgi:multidrug resistance efflux pump